MRRMHGIVLLVALVALAPVLAGCESFDNEKFDIFGLNEKKKLKGERKELFPEGVPGVTQGLPPEYLNKQQPPQPDTAQTPPATPANTTAALPNEKAATPAQPGKTAAIEPAPEPKPKAKPKRKPKPHIAAQPAKQATVQPAAPKQNSGQQPSAPWPDQKQAQSPWPDQNQGQSQSQRQSTGASPWPAAPAPGTFSR
jgi:hypothetical protein